MGAQGQPQNPLLLLLSCTVMEVKTRKFLVQPK